MNTYIYNNICSIHRDDFASREEYLQKYREYCRLYAYKVRVEGGWMFFAHADDYDAWRNQK